MIYHMYKEKKGFILNRKVSTPNYSSVYREGKSPNLLISARHRRSLRLRFNPTRIPWTGDGVSCVKEYNRKVVTGGEKEKSKIQQNEKSLSSFSLRITVRTYGKSRTVKVCAQTRFLHPGSVCKSKLPDALGLRRWEYSGDPKKKNQNILSLENFFTQKQKTVK